MQGEMCLHNKSFAHKEGQYTNALLSICHNDNVYLLMFESTVFCASSFLLVIQVSVLLLPILPIPRPKLAKP